MKNIITIGLAIIIATVFSVSFVNEMLLQSQISKLNDYHYALVNEIESSDFAQSIIDEALANDIYNVKIENRGVKDDLRIYQVTTSKEITMPIFGFSKVYVKESTAR